MTYGYSTDLRTKALDYYDRSGKTQAEVSKIFGISLRTFGSWVGLRRSGDIRLRATARRKTPHKLDDAAVSAYVSRHPDAYLHEIAEHFRVHQTSILRCLDRLAITRKKKPAV